MEVDQNDQQEQGNKPFQVPVFLRVLSVLSLIAIIFGLLRGVLGLVEGPASEEMVNQVIEENMDGVERLENMGETGWAETTFKILNLVRYTNANFYMDQLINLGAYAIGLAGVMFMLRGRKLGFHLYIIYNLLALVSIYASAPASAVPPVYFIVFGSISLIFIFMYSRNLKGMV